MNALPTVGRTDLSLAVVRQCLRARSLFSLGMIVGSRSVLQHALMLVYETSEQVPSGQLPFIDGGIPFIHEVISHARSRWAAIQKAEHAYEVRQSNKRAAHEAYVKSFPAAQGLMDQAAASGDRLEFHGYTLWKCEHSEGAWDVTNAYGIDNCARLDTLGGFEWFLDQLRAGADIGPTPPCSDNSDDSDDWHWMDCFDEFDWVKPVDQVLDRILADKDGFGTGLADPASDASFSRAVESHFGAILY